MVTQLNVKPTDVQIKAAGIDFANVPFTLWHGVDGKGNPIQAWVPDWVPEHFYDAAWRHDAKAGPAQDMHAYRQPRRRRVIRSNKRKGGN